MTDVFTSGQPKADKVGERKINKTGVVVGVAVLAVIMVLFLIFFGGVLFNAGSKNGGATNSAANSRSIP